jgi:hypothetical protein
MPVSGCHWQMHHLRCLNSCSRLARELSLGAAAAAEVIDGVCSLVTISTIQLQRRPAGCMTSGWTRAGALC